jgi:CheY-like chemotaxis protein
MNKFSSRVLAIEDASSTIREIAGDLRDSGIQVDYATSIPESGQMLKREKYDCLLVDVMIVGSDGSIVESGGLEVIHHLRSGDFGSMNCDTPFFVLTGQKPSLDESALAKIPGCLGVEKNSFNIGYSQRLEQGLVMRKVGR